MSESNRSTGSQNQYAQPLHFILRMAEREVVETPYIGSKPIALTVMLTLCI